MKLAENNEGTIIEVFVKPNQREFRITLDAEDIIVSSTEEPAKNKVNKEIIREFSKIFHTQVELVSGATSREKKFEIEGLSKDEVMRILSRKTGYSQ